MRKLLLSISLPFVLAISSVQSVHQYYDHRSHIESSLQQPSLKKRSIKGIIIRVILSSIVSAILSHAIEDLAFHKDWHLNIGTKIAKWTNWAVQDMDNPPYKFLWVLRACCFFPIFILINSVICYLIFETFGAHSSEKEQKD